MIEFYKKYFSILNSQKNWEDEVLSVRVEACGCEEDPLGYRAVFVIDQEDVSKNTFAIGASLLPQREDNLRRSGYKAPMTHKAIALIENKIGSRLAASA